VGLRGGDRHHAGARERGRATRTRTHAHTHAHAQAHMHIHMPPAGTVSGLCCRDAPSSRLLPQPPCPKRVTPRFTSHRTCCTAPPSVRRPATGAPTSRRATASCCGAPRVGVGVGVGVRVGGRAQRIKAQSFPGGSEEGLCAPGRRRAGRGGWAGLMRCTCDTARPRTALPGTLPPCACPEPPAPVRLSSRAPHVAPSLSFFLSLADYYVATGTMYTPVGGAGGAVDLRHTAQPRPH
jgi:hypothetical protein